MGRHSTYPTLYDECKRISISDLKRWEYLNPHQNKSGVITWSRNGNQTGRISISINTQSVNPYLELDYAWNDKPINYRIQLVSLPSNLGKGVVWFFICPHTGCRCRVLHLIGGYFYHRTAFNGCFYEKQTESHRHRRFEKRFGESFRIEKILSQNNRKKIRQYYNGKPTKRYLKLLKQLNEPLFP